MNAPTDKDYIDAKLQAVIERLNGDQRPHQIATDARLDKLDKTIEYGLQAARDEFNARFTQIEATLEHGLHAVRDEFNAKLAQVEANFSRALADAIKWMIGTMIALTMLSITVSSILFLHVAPKQAAAVKAPADAGSSPQAALTAHDAKKSYANSQSVARSVLPAAIPPTRPTKTMH